MTAPKHAAHSEDDETEARHGIIELEESSPHDRRLQRMVEDQDKKMQIMVEQQARLLEMLAAHGQGSPLGAAASGVAAGVASSAPEPNGGHDERAAAEPPQPTESEAKATFY